MTRTKYVCAMNTNTILRRCILPALAAGTVQLGLAQSYLFEHVTPGSQPYEALLGDTEIPGFDFAGNFVMPGIEGENIRFFDKVYTIDQGTQLLINKDGYLRITDDNTMALIEGAHFDMYPYDATSRYSYRLFGNPGNRVLAVQYSNLRSNTGPSENSLSFQIWYHQNTGLIEVRFGARTQNIANSFTLNRGPKMGIYHSPTDMTGCLEKIWLTGDPQAPAVSYDANYDFDAMNGVPPEGTVYRFGPTFIIGLEENAAPAAGIRNNPATEDLFVTVENAGTTLVVQDMAGRTIRTATATTGENAIDVSDLAAGTYVLVDRYKEARHAQRFMKQ